MTNKPSDVNDTIEQYSRTCSIFYRCSAKFADLCDGTIAKQINSLEAFAGTKIYDKAKTWPEMILEPFFYFV